MKRVVYLLIGVVFGITMYKSEASSWFRIYEMFQFQSFHMYGIIMTAVLLGVAVVQLLKYKNAKTFEGNIIVIKDKPKFFKKYLFGGIVFGMGWALTGACPGPMFVLLGVGFVNVGIVVVFAVLGTFVYGRLKDKLPH